MFSIQCAFSFKVHLKGRFRCFEPATRSLHNQGDDDDDDDDYDDDDVDGDN